MLFETVMEVSLQKINIFTFFKNIVSEKKLPLKKLLKCDQCPKTFYEPKDLSMHVSQFNHSQKILCKECEYSCWSKSLLQKHVDIVHLKLKPGFNCEKCNKIFVTGMKFRQHKKRCQ